VVSAVRASARRTHSDLVQAVRRTRVAGGDLALWPIGGAGYIVKSATALITIDPFTGPSNPPRWIRAIPPAFDPARLAGVDAVVLTHEHDDHTDPTTLTALLAHTQALVIGSAACVAVTRGIGYPPECCRLLRHEQALAVKDVRLTAVAMHDPGAQDCNGYVVETPDVAILHCGDSLYFDGFRALARRWTLDAILVSVGVSPPGETLYMDEADAARAARDSGAQTLIPQHFDLWQSTAMDPRRVVTVAGWYCPGMPVIPAYVKQRITISAH